MPARRALVLAAMLCAACAARRSSEKFATSPSATDVSDHGVAQRQGSESERPHAGAPEKAYDLVPPAVVNALAGHDYERALAVADAAASSTRSASPWLDYDRAEALAGLGRTDEAIDAFKRAEQRFLSEGQNIAGQSAAIWGRARALAGAGRCSEARRAYDEYGAVVRTNDPAAEEMAALYSGQCRPLVSLH